MRSLPCLFLLVAVSCTRAPSTIPSIPAPAATPEHPVIPADSRPISWIFTPDFSSRSYIVVESTTVALDARQDSSVGQTGFTVSVSQPGADTSVRGVLDLISGIEAHPAVTTLPLSFSGTMRNGALTIDSISGQRLPTVLPCDNPLMGRLSVIRRSLFVAPLTLSRNQSWTDSSTVPACSGPVSVQVTNVRTYQVLGETDGKVVLERQDKIVAAGEGAQGQHRITIQSRGTGSSRLQLDRATGALVSAAGVSQLEIDVRSSGRVQHFRQVVRDRVTLR